MAIDYQNKFSALMLANILLGPLAGLISTITLTVDGLVTEMTIVASCIGFITGTIAAITKFGKYDETSTIHKGASIKFSALEANIKRQLTLPTNARSRPDEYLTFIDNSYESLVSSAPLTSFVVDDCVEQQIPTEISIDTTNVADSPRRETQLDQAEVKPEPRLEYELNRMFSRK